MLFKQRHIQLIRIGEKTVTRRMWKPNYPTPNVDTIRMAKTHIFESHEECNCYIRITEEPYKQRLGDMTAEDAQKEGDYESVAEFKKAWRDINGEWNPDWTPTVVPFEYYGTSHPER